MLLAAKKAKVKNWYTVVAPKLFGEKEIGKTFANEPESLIGRKIVLNLAELTGNFSKYYMKFIFKIGRVNGDRAFSEFDGSECLRDYISRMIVRRIRRVDTVQDLETKDGIKIRVKSLTIIPRRVKSSIEKNIRARVSDMVAKEVANSSFEELIRKIIYDEMKNKILYEARKIYPVRNFEIRKTEII